MKTYFINEYFYSIQGEGLRAGTANIFLRFGGCNLTCSKEVEGFDCDTEFTSGRKLTAEQIIFELKANAPEANAIVLTGGEPGLQVDPELISMLKGAGYYLAIETNGTRELPGGLDWITVSPKTAEHTMRQLKANEVKYVRAVGHGIPRPVIKADHYLISPACQADGSFMQRDIDWCIKMVLENPEWRLSVQQHKFWRAR